MIAAVNRQIGINDPGYMSNLIYSPDGISDPGYKNNSRL
jgi:hypothetical protein